MEQKKELNTEADADVREAERRYDAYYNNVLLKEQPFYRSGMSEEEIKRELEYLNRNLKAFYEGGYTPLWRQDLYK